MQMACIVRGGVGLWAKRACNCDSKTVYCESQDPKRPLRPPLPMQPPPPTHPPPHTHHPHPAPPLLLQVLRRPFHAAIIDEVDSILLGGWGPLLFLIVTVLSRSLFAVVCFLPPGWLVCVLVLE